MTKIKFFLSIVIVITIQFLGIFFIGNSSSLYLDISSFLLGILIPYIIISFIYSPKEQLDFNREIFSSIGSGDKIILANSLRYFKSLSNLLIASAVTTSLIGFIGMMANLEDTSSIGPNLAVMTIVSLYIAIYHLVVVEPLRASAEKNLKA